MDERYCHSDTFECFEKSMDVLPRNHIGAIYCRSSRCQRQMRYSDLSTRKKNIYSIFNWLKAKLNPMPFSTSVTELGANWKPEMMQSQIICFCDDRRDVRWMQVNGVNRHFHIWRSEKFISPDGTISRTDASIFSFVRRTRLLMNRKWRLAFISRWLIDIIQQIASIYQCIRVCCAQHLINSPSAHQLVVTTRTDPFCLLDVWIRGAIKKSFR